MKAERRNLESYRNVHLVGIGGIGMSGIAEYLAAKGVKVTGSDLRETQITRRLRWLGAEVSIGHAAENVSPDCELLIYTSALDDENPELKQAKANGIEVMKRAAALGLIVNGMFVIGVSGTHGKTTTTAMIAKMLIDADMDPTVFVGGSLDFLEGGASRIGSGEIAVVEADEYDRSFLQLRPDIIVITNIDADHLDIYNDMNEIIDNFRLFIERRKNNGKIIACGDDPDVTAALKGFGNSETYGFRKSNGHVVSDLNFEGSRTEFSIDGHIISIRVPGAHNALNSTACFLAGRELKLSANMIGDSLRDFTGVNRRLELKYENGLMVFDDYAHHPEEVRASLDAIRKLGHGSRIITIFQPHLFTRTRDFFKEFAESFKDTDLLLLAKIYPAREKEIEGVSSRLILNEYFKLGKNGIYIENPDEIIETLESISKEGDIIVFQGAGDITGICDRFVKKMQSKNAGAVPL
jgi:UDP-N-acetylmuramate--alanine ligase